MRVPPGGKRVSKSVNPWFAEPSAETTIDAPMSQADVFAWYKSILPASGWVFDPAYVSSNEKGGTSIRFVREVPKSACVGALSPETQTMDIDVTPIETQGCRIDIYAYCNGSYVGDLLTSWVVIPFYYAGGERGTFLPLFILF